jgi:hypothetical protein
VPEGVRILTVIAGPDSPMEYAYPLTLPDGARLIATDDGGFKILGARAQVLAHGVLRGLWMAGATSCLRDSQFAARH